MSADILWMNFNVLSNVSGFIYMRFTDIYELPEDDQDRSKHFGFTTSCVLKNVF